ncbi:MAG: carboxypeptidase-like regulatory domain-containing protein [Balneolales bacterium]|nr:carboxypeptidase-like regulatory domain-containing protein [Balneolales bacterium]
MAIFPLTGCFPTGIMCVYLLFNPVTSQNNGQPEILDATEAEYSLVTHFQDRDLTGSIVDAKTGETVPFAHIFVINAGDGTAADRNGRFRLRASILTGDDIRIRVSAVGYETAEFPIEDIQGDESTILLSLTPLTYERQAAVLIGERLRNRKIHNRSFWWNMGFNRTAVGGHGARLRDHVSHSIAQKIVLEGSAPARIEEVRIHIGGFSSGLKTLHEEEDFEDQKSIEVQIRLRIQNLGADNIPGEISLLQQQYIKKIEPNSGYLSFDLSDMDVFVEEESFFIILDLIVDDIETYHGVFPLYSVINSGANPMLMSFGNTDGWGTYRRSSKHELLYEITYEY